MREGAALVTSRRVKKVNLNYIVKKLERCYEKYSGCDDCPDFKACRGAYDDRCSLGETICPACHSQVPIDKYCAECGEYLKPKAKKDSSRVL